MSPEKEWLRIRKQRPFEQPLRQANRAPQARPPARQSTPGILTARDLRALGGRVGNGTLQRLAREQEFTAPERVERSIESQRGGGSPLDHTTRQQMEGAMGADLSGVRIHDNNEAAALNGDLSARAFTHGSDIFFSEGEYAPGHSEGQRLLAHELTHVMQQRDGAKLQVGAANDPAEAEADAVADAVVQRLGQDDLEEEELQMVRRQPEEEEEELQMLRRQDDLEEEELLV